MNANSEGRRIGGCLANPEREPVEGGAPSPPGNPAFRRNAAPTERRPPWSLFRKTICSSFAPIRGFFPFVTKRQFRATTKPMSLLTRRRFLELAATSAGAFALRSVRADEAQTPLPPLSEGTSFFLVGDTHYLANKEKPETLDEVSRAYTSGLIGWLNKIPEMPLPEDLGGTKLPLPAGLIHAGDLIDTGDKNGAPFTTMQETEFNAWAADFGLNGGDGRLPYPVREVHGNHDAPRGTGLVLDQIRERNKKRAGLANVCENGVHCSWDWGGVHFINLGIVVGGSDPASRGYPALGSLEFLISDLATQVGTSGRPVVLTHHVDVARYCAPPKEPPLPAKFEWEFADVRAYFDALKNYRIAAILYGHTHTRRIFGWDGTPPVKDGAPAGIPVFTHRQRRPFQNARPGVLSLADHGQGDHCPRILFAGRLDDSELDQGSVAPPVPVLICPSSALSIRRRFRTLPADARHPFHSVLYRLALPEGRDLDGPGARTARAHDRLSRRTNVLRPATV